MPQKPLSIGDPVLLTTTSGTTTKTSAALVFGIYQADGLNGANGEPFIDVVTINLANMKKAGSADWVEALTREVGVRHASHQDVIDGKIGISYVADGDDIALIEKADASYSATKADPAADGIDLPQTLGVASTEEGTAADTK